MNKGVTNLPSYQRVSRAANDRYLNALSVVNDPTPAYQQVADLTESKTHRGRRYAGFNPARKDDVRLFQAVLSACRFRLGSASLFRSESQRSSGSGVGFEETPANCQFPRRASFGEPVVPCVYSLITHKAEYLMGEILQKQ